MTNHAYMKEEVQNPVVSSTITAEKDEFQLGKACLLNDPECEACQ